MERERTNPMNHDERATRLSQYLGAAGLGAFACGGADAGITYVDVPDAGQDFGWRYLDLNQDATADVGLFRGGGYGGYTIFEVANNYAGSGYPFQLSDTVTRLTSDPVQFASFAEGDLIGAGSATTGDRGMSDPYGYGNAIGTGRYVGFAIDFDGDGGTNYGWIRMDITPGSFADIIVYEWAINTEDGQAILAGEVPAPGSLALLAAGLGGLGLRKRREP